MPTQEIKTRRPIKRISTINIPAIKEAILILAAIGPPDQTQRSLFIKLIPQFFVLKKRFGYTFKQIAQCCNDNGLELSQSTVRVYYEGVRNFV